MQHEYFMELALHQAKQALAQGEFPVGCVIACNGEVLATGARKHTTKNKTNEIDHAEIMALKKLADLDPVPETGLSLYCTMEPCLMCFAAIILNNINEVIYAYEDVMGGGTGCDLAHLTPLYRNSGVKIIPHVFREQSVELFKTFFKHPDNDYWKGSLLERYTLAQ